MTQPKLNRRFLSEFRSSAAVNYSPAPANLPERVLQFGEGNFLRAFVDWMIHKLNAAGKFGGRIVVAQPIAQGLADLINSQDGLHTVLLRGSENGAMVDEREIVESISRVINPYGQFEQLLAVARDPNIRFVVSNTTEAGIVVRADDKAADSPPASFPAKLTRLLLERYNALGNSTAPGWIMLPCELIERNGDNLKKAVLQTAQHWQLPADFLRWLESKNEFANTLVDRIVTGYPKEDAEKLAQELGYTDALMAAGEPFHFWVIEANPSLSKELPFDSIGLNVVWTRDMTPYRERKVRILNGAHTMMAPAAFLAGKNTVGECMADAAIRNFMVRGIQEEIIPTLDLPADDLQSFASAVQERFANPFVQHQLLSIALNSTSKFKARVLPSIKQFIAGKGELPRRLTFSMSALIAFYRGEKSGEAELAGRRDSQNYPIKDSPDALKIMQAAWSTGEDRSAAQAVLSSTALWDEDLTALPGFTDAVTANLQMITREGVARALPT